MVPVLSPFSNRPLILYHRRRLAARKNLSGLFVYLTALDYLRLKLKKNHRHWLFLGSDQPVGELGRLESAGAFFLDYEHVVFFQECVEFLGSVGGLCLCYLVDECRVV